MAISTKIDQVTDRVERLLLRHEELQRTNVLLTEQLNLLAQERDSLKSRLSAARARVDALLERLPGSIDLSAEALPFMGWSQGDIAGIPARIFRISFSGELSYEIAVPANRGLELWERLHEVGRDLGITPYGTEAMHVMRAEKGFIMIGDETHFLTRVGIHQNTQFFG